MYEAGRREGGGGERYERSGTEKTDEGQIREESNKGSRKLNMKGEEEEERRSKDEVKIWNEKVEKMIEG